MLISKQHHDWREWQEIFEDYKASLTFKSADELTDFLKTEYNLSGIDSTSFSNALNQYNSDCLILEFPEDKSRPLNFVELNAGRLH